VDAAERQIGAHVVRVLLDQRPQMRLGLVAAVEIGEVERELELGDALQRRGGRHVLVEIDRLGGPALQFGDLSELDQHAVEMRRERARILQVEPHEGLAAAAVQRRAEIVERLGRTVGGRGDQRLDGAARLDGLAQHDDRRAVGGEGIGLVEDGERLVLAGFAGEHAGVAFGRAQPRLGRGRAGGLVGHRLRIGGRGDVAHACRFGDQRAVVALEERVPLRPLHLVELVERERTVALAEIGPAGHQPHDQPVEIGRERELEQVFGGGVILPAEGVDGERQAREAFDLRHRLQLFGIGQRPVEMAARDQREHDALLDGQIVAVEIERPLVIGDRRVEIIVGLGRARRQNGAREGAHLNGRLRREGPGLRRRKGGTATERASQGDR
jgi:hypothetical protein